MKGALLLLALLWSAAGQWGHQGRGGHQGHGGQQNGGAADIDPYKILDLSKDATPKQIKTAYRKLSLKYHPDKNKAADAKKKMQDVSNAYEMIADPDKKLIFDEFGTGEKFYSKWQYEQNQRRKGKQVSKKGFYAGSDDVVTLTLKNFYQNIKPNGMLVEFYAPWCVHCQDMVSEYKKAAILLEDVMKVGAVNCEANQKLCRQQGINSYPSMKLFMPLKEGDNPHQQEVEEFNEQGHEADVFYSFVKQSMSTANVALTDANFQQVYDGSVWLVDFSAGQWCGPCTALKSYVRKLAASVEGFAKVGIINCDDNPQTCGDLNVQFYPQLRVFREGVTPREGQLLESNNQFPAAGTMDIFETLIKILNPRPSEDSDLLLEDEGSDVGEGGKHEEL